MTDLKEPYLTLDDIDKSNVNRRIVVRLIRQWEARNPRKGNQLMSLDLLLLDENDNLIKASINHRLIEKFKPKLHEGYIHEITDFDIAKSYEKYKMTDHKFTIYFNHMTKVTEVVSNAPIIKKTKFRIKHIDSLLSLANTNEELTDVIGKIVFILGSNLRDPRSTNKIMASLILQDGSKVRLSIWDNIASDFRIFLSSSNRKKKVVIITALNPKMFSGDLYLNTTAATRFCIGNDLPEVNNFFSLNKLESDSPSPLTEREMEPVNYSMTPISDMLSFVNDEQPQEKTFFCKATIIDIVTRNGWNYVSCSKCLKKLMKDKTTFTCPQCNDANITGIVRYRIEMNVEDETEKGTFIIFDKDGRNLTNTLASELVSFENPNEDPDIGLPSCIQDLSGRTFIFEIIIKPFDFKSRYKTFTVGRVINECFDNNSEKGEEVSEEKKDKDNQILKTDKHYVKKRKKDEIQVKNEEPKRVNDRGKRKKHDP